MKVKLLFLFLTISNVAFLQSKKTQIELMTAQIDSLSLVIYQARLQDSIKTQNHQTIVHNFEDSLQRNYKSIQQLQLDLQSMTLQKQNSERELNAKLNNLDLEFRKVQAEFNDQIEKQQKELSASGKLIQDLKNDLAKLNLVGVYDLPADMNTCNMQYELIIRSDMRVQLISTCFRPFESISIEDVGVLTLNSPLKFDWNMSAGFLFKENGFYLIDNTGNNIYFNGCCDESQMLMGKECECFIPYSAKK